MENLKLPDLKTWRKKYGFSQKKLADAMKVSLATFRQLELGRGRKPQKRTLNKLAKTIEEVERKAAKAAPAAKLETAVKAKKVDSKAVAAEKPKKRGRKPKVEAKTPAKRRGRKPEVVESIQIEPQTEGHIEISNLDLELINRILKLSGKEKLELLQRLL